MTPLVENRAKCLYTPYYCEENIYKLCESLDSSLRQDCHVIFISNEKEATPLWKQSKGRPDQDFMVCWDYHVILIHHPPNKASMVYDFDTILPFPVSFREYFNSVFRPGAVTEEYIQQFRVIDSQVYLETFASDRSRMKNPDGTFIQPPPSYECIQTRDSTNNLNQFISMTEEFKCGKILELFELESMFDSR